jgi:hypothetical protein
MEDMLEGATTQMAHPMANSAPELDTATRLAYDRTRLA